MEDNEIIKKEFEREDSMVPYPELILHIIGVGRTSLQKCLTLARDIVSEAIEDEVTLLELVHDTDDKDIKEQLTLYMRGMTTQGPMITHAKGGSFHIEVPFLSTPWDIELCFAICKAAKQLKPDCVVILNDNTEHEFSLMDENKGTMIHMCKENMRAIMEGCTGKNKSIGMEGLNKKFFISRDYIKETCKGLRGDNRTWRIYQKFLELQWDYNELDAASLMQVTDPGDDKPYPMRVLANAGDSFIGHCFKLALMDEDGNINKVLVSDFMDYMKDNPHVIPVDAEQFIIRKMPKKAWTKIVKEVPGDYLPHRNTFIMRWNPAISGFKWETYCKCYKECKDGFHTDWCIRDYKKAKDGDLFYMLRDGEGKTGIVWRGLFTSEPYEDEDWAGDKNKRCMYVEMDVYDYFDPEGEPFISTKELQEAIPDFSWAKGHTGELLTREQASALEDLWYKKQGETETVEIDGEGPIEFYHTIPEPDKK